MQQPSRQTSSVKAPVGTILHQCRRTLVVAFFLTVVANILSITPVVYMINVYDRVLSSRSEPTLVSLLIIVIGLYLFWCTMEWVRSRLMVRLSLRIDWEVAAKAFDASFRRHVTQRNVNVHRVLGNVLTLRQFMTGQPLLAIMDAPFAIVFIAIGATFHPYLAVFSLVASLIMLTATWSTQKATTPQLRAANEASAEASRLAAFNLRHAEPAYALGMHGEVRKRWYAKHRDFLEHQVNASESTGLLGGVSSFLMRALPSLQISLGCWLAIEGLITGGMIIAASILISKAISPINKLLTSWKEIVSARQAYEELNALLEEDEEAATSMRLPAPVGRLVVAGASAVAPGRSKPILSNISFSVDPGQTVAIVGPSASGKTTLTRLLTGVWKPAGGSVRLDGVEISAWNHEELGPQIGYVPQEIDFFEGTVAENIARLGKVDSAKVVEAAKLIDAHDMILGFPKGYDTVLAENGFIASAGQRQRIAIARALYGMPRYLVMDEPNSNLDDHGEQALANAIAAMKAANATVIITTHRPKLISVVDNLLVLRDGQQVRFGPVQGILEAVRRQQSPAAPQEVRADPAAPAVAPGQA